MDKNGDLKWKTDNAIDEAYRRGFDDGKEKSVSKERARHIADYHYQRGLKDAWECAKKIAGMKWEDCEKLFNLANLSNIIFDFTAQEAMQKIKDYEERQTERACSNCFYERQEADEDPCRDCGTLLEGHTNWRPKVKKEETK